MLLAALFLTALSGAPAQAAPDDGSGVLTLRAAIGEALRASPALLPAHEEIVAADIQKRLTDSRYGVRFAPDFLLGADAGGLRQQQAGLTVSRRLPTGTELSVAATWTNYGERGHELRDAGYSIFASQSVVHAFSPAGRAPLLDARRAVTRADRLLHDTRARLVVRAADAYFTIVRERLLLDAAAHALERANTLRLSADARARAGLATELDVLRAELLASTAEATVHAQRESFERATDALKLLLGRRLDAPLAVDVRAIPAVPADVPAAEPPAAAIERRLDVKEARDRVADARRAESVARWSLWPDVQLTAGFTRRGLNGGAAAAFNDITGGWRVGVRTTYGFDRAALAASAATAALSSAAAQRAAVETEQAVAADVRDAQRALARSHTAIAIHRKALEVAERQAKLAHLRYERGLADNLDLVSAEGYVLQARSALIGAQVDCALARLALDRATGQLNPDEYTK